jgi:hypothetical protein
MKRGKIIPLLFILLFTIQLALAVEISLSKESYQPQELLQAEITGNFVSLTTENIFIYKDGKLHPEPVIKDLTKQNNIYYFYAILPNQEGNFSFVIEDTEYVENTQTKSDSIKRNLTLQFKDEAALSINPGFLKPTEDFSIKLTSISKNSEITAIFEATQESKTLSLIEDIEEIVMFKLSELPVQQSKITIGEYEIPVFLTKTINKSIIQNNLEFIPYQLEGTIMPGESYNFQIILKNLGEEKATDILLTSDLNMAINPNNITSIDSQGLETINLTILIPKTAESQVSGKLTAKISENLFHLPILFETTENESEVEVIEIISPPPKATNCSVGEKCNEDEICYGEPIETSEGTCCIGECQKEDSGLSWITITIIILLIAAILFGVWKIRGRHEPKFPKDILRDRSDKFEKRIKNQDTKEVSGKLDSI